LKKWARRKYSPKSETRNPAWSKKIAESKTCYWKRMLPSFGFQTAKQESILMEILAGCASIPKTLPQ